MKAILAMAKNRCIGKDGKIPWHYSGDLKWFKEFTLHKSILIGGNTYRSLPMLVNRTIWVLSKTYGEAGGCLSAPDEWTMYHYTSNVDIIPKDVIIAGGKSIYELFLPQITEFYVTHIDKEYEGDTFMFPFEHLFNKQEVIREFEFGKVIKYSK